MAKRPVTIKKPIMWDLSLLAISGNGYGDRKVSLTWWAFCLPRRLPIQSKNMANFFGFAFFLSLLVLLVGLLKPTLLKLETRKAVWWRVGSVTLVLFILIGVASPKVEPEQKTEQKVVKAAEQPTVLTLDQKLQNFVKGKSSYFTFTKNEQGDELVTVTYNIVSFYTRDYLLHQSGEISSNVFQEIFTANPKITNVVINYTATTTDKYGNDSLTTALAYFMNRATFSKINWENFSKRDLCAFAKTESKDSLGTNCVERVKIN